MCPDDKDPSVTEAQLESLVAAAEKTRANRKAPQQSLNVQDAENTLNSLLEAADDAGQKQVRRDRRRKTRTAMEDFSQSHMILNREAPSSGRYGRPRRG